MKLERSLAEHAGTSRRRHALSLARSLSPSLALWGRVSPGTRARAPGFAETITTRSGEIYDAVHERFDGRVYAGGDSREGSLSSDSEDALRDCTGRRESVAASVQCIDLKFRSYLRVVETGVWARVRWSVCWRATGGHVLESLELSIVQIGYWKRTGVTSRERAANRYCGKGGRSQQTSCAGARSNKSSSSCRSDCAEATVASRHNTAEASRERERVRALFLRLFS